MPDRCAKGEPFKGVNAAYVGLTGDAYGPAYWATLTGAVGVLAALAIGRRARSGQAGSTETYQTR